MRPGNSLSSRCSISAESLATKNSSVGSESESDLIDEMNPWIGLCSFDSSWSPRLTCTPTTFLPPSETCSIRLNISGTGRNPRKSSSPRKKRSKVKICRSYLFAKPINLPGLARQYSVSSWPMTRLFGSKLRTSLRARRAILTSRTRGTIFFARPRELLAAMDGATRLSILFSKDSRPWSGSNKRSKGQFRSSSSGQQSLTGTPATRPSASAESNALIRLHKPAFGLITIISASFREILPGLCDHI